MWQIYGQDHITRQLDSALNTGRVSHAYLLVGPPHVGKMALALGMAQAINCLASGPRATRRSPQPLADLPEPDPAPGLFADLGPQPEGTSPYLLEDKEVYSQPLTGTADDTGGSVPCGQCSQCQRVAQGVHPDIRIIGVGSVDDEGVNRRDIRIEQVREIESFLNLTPYEGACKVVVVDGAELMNTAAANALLKTLEEPPPESLMLLLTANEDALLPTIRSRCSALYLKPVPKTDLQERLTQDHAVDSETAELVARLSRGCFGQAINALRDYQALEQRQADLERLMQVCEGGLDVRFDYASEVATQFGRDRVAARELLYLWLRWWRDLLLVKEGGEEYLHNSDLATALRLQATELSTADVVAFIKRLNRTLEALDANANPRLTLESLVMGLPQV
ncbi:MAG: DNA polymerase III subunit delta' [Chloroflexota bacterium]|nr:DNA polymerase III subunit delta' [Chloroflexota bacterium]